MPLSAPDSDPSVKARLENYPLWRALVERRSRRFGMGMRVPGGPLAYQSRFPSRPLSEEEEGALAFAACGITGYALADLCYERGKGGNMIGGLVGRTVASGDALQSVAMAVINDSATYFLRRPQDMTAKEVEEAIGLAKEGAVVELYRRARVKLADRRCTPPVEPVYNLNMNEWSAAAQGSTYFLPINDLTPMYINGLLDILNETTGVYILDERAGFRPAGLARFARSKGGHLDDDPRKGRVATIELVERLVTEFVTLEQGMMIQNLGLAAQGLGLGGFPNFANHEFGWFEALGFRMGRMPASQYLGAGRLISLAMKLTGKDSQVPYPLGLERDCQVLLKASCPPYYESMTAAVRSVVETKFGASGVFRGSPLSSAWQSPTTVREMVPPISEAAIEATAAYCEYVWQRYGRFPAYLAPFRTAIGYQATHLDAEFYDRFYRPEALAETQREDFRRTTSQRATDCADS